MGEIAPHNVRTTFMLHRDDHAALRALAETGDTSLAGLLRDLVRAYLEVQQGAPGSSKPGARGRSS